MAQTRLGIPNVGCFLKPRFQNMFYRNSFAVAMDMSHIDLPRKETRFLDHLYHPEGTHSDSQKSYSITVPLLCFSFGPFLICFSRVYILMKMLPMLLSSSFLIDFLGQFVRESTRLCRGTGKGVRQHNQYIFFRCLSSLRIEDPPKIGLPYIR